MVKQAPYKGKSDSSILSGRTNYMNIEFIKQFALANGYLVIENQYCGCLYIVKNIWCIIMLGRYTKIIKIEGCIKHATK